MRLIRPLAVIGIVFSAGILVALALPGYVHIPLPVMLGLAPLALLPFIVSAATNIAMFSSSSTKLVGWFSSGLRGWLRHDRRIWSMLRQALPIWVLVGAGLLAVTFVLVAFTAFDPLTAVGSGSPEHLGGGYVANNHGTITPISLDEYLKLREREQETVAAFAGALSVVGAVLASAFWHRRPAPDPVGNVNE